MKELAAETGFQNGSGQIGRPEVRAPESAGELTMRRSGAFKTEASAPVELSGGIDLILRVEAAVGATRAETGARI